MRIRVARSARKHRTGNAHILAAMVDAGEPSVDPDNDQLVYVGRDDRGGQLYIIAVPDNRNPEVGPDGDPLHTAGLAYEKEDP